MMALNPFFTGSLIFIGIILLAVIAFWIVYGIKKYKWAMIVSIVVSSIFVFMLGTSGMRMITARTIAGTEKAASFTKVERAMERKDHGFLNKKGPFDFKDHKDSEAPKIDPEGIDKDSVEKTQNR